MTRVHLTADTVTVETSGDAPLVDVVAAALAAWDRTRPPPAAGRRPPPVGFTAGDVLHTTPPHLERAPYVDHPADLGDHRP